MLPDFPELKEKLEKGVYIYLGIVANQGIMSEMRRETHLEGNRVGNQSEEGNIELSDYKVIRAESCVSRADVITKGPIAFIQNAQNMAEQIRKQQIEMLINKLQEATAKTGNITYQEFYPRLSKPIIDEIDKVLAQHYGFTDEELDFIINYDIKYRMGKELEDEE